MNLKNYKIWATLNTTIVFSPYSRTWPFNIFSNTVTGNWSISKLRNTFTDNTFDFSQGASNKYWLIRSKYRCVYKKSNDVEENIKGCAEDMHHRSNRLIHTSAIKRKSLHSTCRLRPGFSLTMPDTGTNFKHTYIHNAHVHRITLTHTCETFPLLAAVLISKEILYKNSLWLLLHPFSECGLLKESIFFTWEADFGQKSPR